MADYTISGGISVINWINRRRFFAIAAAATCILPFTVSYAASDSMRDVDVAIVFSIDTSFSIDRENALRQRDGHARALRSKRVLNAIKSGPRGCIAIAYIEWSGQGSVRKILPWTIICDGNQAAEAARIIVKRGFAGVSRRAHRLTSISYAIDVGNLLLDGFPADASRKVIDISSNGTNNDGVPVAVSRGRALSRGHVINAIVLPPADPRHEPEDLPGYFRENIIGGPGSFVIAPREPNDYCTALLRKLVQEIAGVRERAISSDFR